MQYLCEDTSNTTQNVTPWFNITNSLSASVPLSSLTIRYYFTVPTDGSTSFIFICNYAQVSCPNVTGTFTPFAPDGGTGTDHYLEVGFTGSGVIGPGGSSGPLELQFHDATFGTFIQSNDYSFDPTKTAFANWSKVTLYQNGALVWGTEP